MGHKWNDKTKLRGKAKGEDCQVRVPGVCNFNAETTVLAHLGGAGMGTKNHDIQGAWCCSSCHDTIDGRGSTQFTKPELTLMHLEGIMRTIEALLKREIIEIKVNK